MKPKLSKKGNWWHCQTRNACAVAKTMEEAFLLWFQYTSVR